MKLRNCPFCGESAELKKVAGGKRYKVVCGKRGCSGRTITKNWATEELAVSVWNSRPDEVIGFFGDNLLAIVDGHPVLKSKVDIKKTAEQWGEPIPPIMVM